MAARTDFNLADFKSVYKGNLIINSLFLLSYVFEVTFMHRFCLRFNIPINSVFDSISLYHYWSFVNQCKEPQYSRSLSFKTSNLYKRKYGTFVKAYLKIFSMTCFCLRINMPISRLFDSFSLCSSLRFGLVALSHSIEFILVIF